MERRAIHIRGIVQGVGFRPFVYHLATRYHLAGMVRNQTGSVVVEVEGETSALDDFLGELADHPPPLALIEHLSWEARPPRGDRDFRIDASTSDPKGAIFISPDATTCPDCLAELFDPVDRRHHYLFLNCTNCGPRLTIITGAPYDRSRTTGVIPALSRLPRRIRRPARPALPRPTGRVPRVRTAPEPLRCARHGDRDR